MKALQFHSWRRSLAFWVVALTIAAAAAMACRRGVPVIDVGPKPLEVDGTISGTVRGPEGTSAVAGRTVAVVNVETGERQTVATSITGGSSTGAAFDLSGPAPIDTRITTLIRGRARRMRSNLDLVPIAWATWRRRPKR